MMLLTQPCTATISTFEWHILPLPSMCPVSRNPQPGSALYVLYQPKACFLEVYSLRAYVNSYIGGKGAIRDMEGTIQRIAQDCANALDVPVCIGAWIVLQRRDAMALVCNAIPQLPDFQSN
jgi:7-cyano-7-deazaguanine reductase